MKIYISKSNQASTHDLAIIRNVIVDSNDTIVEWVPGTPYDRTYAPVKTAGMIIVLPPENNPIIKTDEVDYIFVGAGNYSEIIAHETHMIAGEQEPAMKLFKNEQLYNIIKHEEVKTNWQTEYAKLFIVKQASEILV